MDNAEFARSLVSLADYERMIKLYEKRPLDEAGQLWFDTIVRQRDLKLAEA